MARQSDQPDADENIPRAFEEVSPSPERAVIGAFMVAMALEATAEYTPNSLAAAMILGAVVLKATGFVVGGVVLTSAARSKIDTYLRRKFSIRD